MSVAVAQHMPHAASSSQVSMESKSIGIKSEGTSYSVVTSISHQLPVAGLAFWTVDHGRTSRPLRHRSQDVIFILDDDDGTESMETRPSSVASS